MPKALALDDLEPLFADTPYVPVRGAGRIEIMSPGGALLGSVRIQDGRPVVGVFGRDAISKLHGREVHQILARQLGHATMNGMNGGGGASAKHDPNEGKFRFVHKATGLVLAEKISRPLAEEIARRVRALGPEADVVELAADGDSGAKKLVADLVEDAKNAILASATETPPEPPAVPRATPKAEKKADTEAVFAAAAADVADAKTPADKARAQANLEAVAVALDAVATPHAETSERKGRVRQETLAELHRIVQHGQGRGSGAVVLTHPPLTPIRRGEAATLMSTWRPLLSREGDFATIVSGSR